MTALGELTPTPGPAVPRRRWPLPLGIVSALLIVGVIAVLSPWDRDRGQWLQDQFTVLTQPSPSDITAIADATGMSDEGRLIFLASTPEVEDAEAFNDDCRVESRGTLGCFDGHEIFIYRVTDPRLRGTIEVTAAHEMLHAAYQRLSPADRSAVDALVAAAVDALPADDPAFADLAAYPRSEWPDEWHSRLGSEFGDLPPALERHYDRYFDDRSKVVALAAASTAQLRDLEARLAALQTRIDELSDEIETRTAAYDEALAAYDADVAAFNEKADAGGFESPSQFDAERAALVARQQKLATEQSALNDRVEQHNRLVAELTSLDADYADLYHSLDSTSGPTGSPHD
jgi:hypothetical protein